MKKKLKPPKCPPTVNLDEGGDPPATPPPPTIPPGGDDPPIPQGKTAHAGRKR